MPLFLCFLDIYVGKIFCFLTIFLYICKVNLSALLAHSNILIIYGRKDFERKH